MVYHEVVDSTNNKVAEVELNEKVFNCDINKNLIYEVIKMYLACKRAGNASVKNRALVRGGGKKPFRQKGTGQARMGTLRTPLAPGGGKVFGPTPRDFSYTLPKKIKKAALCSALSMKFKEKKLTIIDKFDLDKIKTKEMVKILNTLNQKNTLIVIEEPNEKIEKSARNIEKVKVLRAPSLNVYDLLKYDNLLITLKGVKKIEGALLS